MKEKGIAEAAAMSERAFAEGKVAGVAESQSELGSAVIKVSIAVGGAAFLAGLVVGFIAK